MNKDIVEIIRYFGVNAQQRKIMEEIFELQESITQYEMAKDNHIMYSNSYLNKLHKHITEEIADVTLMLKQFQRYYDIKDNEIENVVQGKIARTFKKIQEIEEHKS